MPRLIVRHPDGSSRAFSLVKRITAVGSAPDNDVPIPLPGVPESALHLEIDGAEIRLTGHRGTDYTLNGKKKAQGRLSDRDVISLGGASLTLELVEPSPEPAAADLGEFQLLRSLVSVAEQVTGRGDVQAMLEAILDAAIELTRADKGFVILPEGDRLVVRVARNIDSTIDLEDAERGVSDSIVRKAVEARRPILVHDALHDEEFSRSESVVNLKLCSVVCSPLLEKGDLIGLLYLGNDRIAHRFEDRSLELLSVFAAQASLLVRNALLANELRLESAQLKRQLDEAQYGDLIGACPGMREIYRRIDKVAATDISVLVGGETGTGKEMLAREIHRRSSRAKGPFVAINCGAIPENLLESELFGHVRGAFTGAVATRQGRFQAANGGTLFLDEVGDMPMSLQVKILRALQERTVIKVGDARPEAVDIRVVAATHRVLEEEVKAGRFREDLYYRLNVIKLVVPPLRERGDDVLILARWLLRRFSEGMKTPARGFSKAANDAMRRYGWPGNVRELENRLKKAMVLSDRALLGPEDLELSNETLDPVVPLIEAKAAFQRDYINRVLERNGGNRTKTAKDLGVDARTIFRHLERLEAEREGRAPPPADEGELDD